MRRPWHACDLPAGPVWRSARDRTITIATDGSTTYHQQAGGAASDVTAGQEVLVQTSGGTAGAAAPAGSGTAQTRAATDVTIVGN